jgi:PKD repeat protein
MFLFKTFASRIFILGLLLTVIVGCKKNESSEPLPVANFYMEYTEFVDDTCKLFMYDNSYNASGWEWKINDILVSESMVDSSIIVDGNMYKIELTVVNVDESSDFKVKYIDFTN